ncbi:MAG: DUF2520 domain-containing protein [Bacteroidales bacterium]|nr:DUF2520 domain-containing protein [Bacteroidales bacterium]
MSEIKKIVLIGAGNLATHLAIALKHAGKEIMQIYSRSIDSAKILANLVQTDYCTDLSKITDKADLYIIAVKDDVLTEIVRALVIKNKLIVHTSGSVTMNVLGQCSTNFGVFYPLLTFSKDHDLNFSKIPLCIEANTNYNLELLKHLALSLTDKVFFINSEQRKILHLAAVFASNFPNFMYSIAETLVKDNNMDFDLLKPLIMETAEKVQTVKPLQAQTGPATRGDHKIMEMHLDLLEKYPEYKNLYLIISNEILRKKNE